MPLFAAAAIAGAAAIGYAGTQATNKANAALTETGREFNAEEALKQRDFNSAEAAKQREWSERLSNTAYQRGMVDMRTAGLNPVLAAHHGGASTPSGASASGVAASGPPPIPALNKLGSAVASAQAAQSLLQTKAQTENIEAQTRNTEVDTRQREATFIDSDQGRDYPKTYNALETQNRALLLNRQMRVEVEREGLTESQRNLVNEEVKNAIQERRRIDAQTRDTTANAVLRELDQAEARNRSRFHKENPTWSEYSNAFGGLGSLVNSAAKLRGMR